MATDGGSHDGMGGSGPDSADDEVTTSQSDRSDGGVGIRPTRRQLLGGAVGLGALAAGVGAFVSTSDRTAATTGMPDDRAAALASRFAPDLFFGAGERWYPTDPRRYASEQDGDRIVDGFDAFDGYAAEFADGDPPAPTVFYRGVEYENAELGVIQFWLYSVFDQFSVNFHWHDWEVLQVFVDLAEETPVLFVASAHSRIVPNNEHLDPDVQRAGIISEVGSHSSGLGVNETRDLFERIVSEGIADVTNSPLDLVDLPAAYGLPRGEGSRLPYVLPELEGAPLYEHPDLPNVDRSDLVPPNLTVREFDAAETPPADLPTREAGLVFSPEAASDPETADHLYTLEPMSAVADIATYEGPQLSFEFSVPKFAEDAVASHLTTTDAPRTQPRFTQPDADITGPRHRRALADRYGIPVTSGAGDIVAQVTEATGTDVVPGDNGIETVPSSVEVVALLETDPTALPTWRGVVAARDVPAGDHRLTINGVGVAPYSQRVAHEPDAEPSSSDLGTESTTTGTAATADPPTTVAGAGEAGEVVVTPNRDAVKLRVDASDDEVSGLSSVAVEDDVAGSVYDAPPDGADRASVYVHRAGAYTAEVVDTEGAIGAFRANPGADQVTATIAEVRTGKASLAAFLETLLSETLLQTDAAINGDGIGSADPPDDTTERGRPPDQDSTGETTRTQTTTTPGSGQGSSGTDSGQSDTDEPGNEQSGLLVALQRAVEAARRALDAAESGDAAATDARLNGVKQRLEAITTALERTNADLPEGFSTLVGIRIEQARRRADQAITQDL